MLVLEKCEKLAQRVAVFKGMSQVGFLDDRVVVSSSDPLMGETTSGLQLGDDSLHRTFGDTDEARNLALTNFRVAADRQQDMGVIRQELPSGRDLHVFTIGKTRRFTRTF